MGVFENSDQLYECIGGLMGALAKKQIIAKGPIPKILKLLPAVQPLYKVYPELLKEKGYTDLVMK
jgi:hypothetical protein